MNYIKEHFVFEFRNEWEQIFGKYNWITFTFLYVYFERDIMLHGYEFSVTVLGLGFYFRYNNDKALAQFKEWDEQVKQEFPV